MLYPIMPIFLTVVLGAPAGVVGVVEGVAEGAAAVTKTVSGRLADRRRRRPLIGLGYGLAALGKVLVAGRIRPLLVLAVLPAIASVALVAALREPARAAAATTAAPVRLRQLPARYWRVVAVLTAFSLVNFPDALLLLRLHDIGFTVSGVIAAYVAYNIVYTLLSYPAGAVADRLPRPVVFATGLVFFAAAYAGLGLTRDHVTAWLLLAGYGAYTACTDGVG